MRRPVLPTKLVLDAVEPFVRQGTADHALELGKKTESRTLASFFPYHADPVPFSTTIRSGWRDGDVVVEKIEYNTGPLTRASAYAIKPKRLKTKLPGLLVFHCHSGVYRWGKEKVFATPADSNELMKFRELKYAGQSIARHFAEKGFFVLAPDAFYFGDRAIGEEGIDAAVGEIDEARRNSEDLVAKILALAGISWPSIVSWEDRRALDYLCERQEVDPTRIGCLGLSFGGFRSLMLAALDRRIRAIVTACWLTTTRDFFEGKIANHSWMVLPWGIYPEIDFPKIVANALPAAFLVLNCSRDHLFSLKNMRKAAATASRYYRKAGAEGLFSAKFFDSPHCMTMGMLESAIEWMETFLVANSSL